MLTYDQWIKNGRECFGCGATAFKTKEDFLCHIRDCPPVQKAISDGKDKVREKFKNWKRNKQSQEFRFTKLKSV